MIRRFLYFVVGFMLAANWVLAHAALKYSAPFWGGLSESQACSSSGLALDSMPSPPTGHSCIKVQAGAICNGAKTWYFCQEDQAGHGAIFTISGEVANACTSLAGKEIRAWYSFDDVKPWGWRCESGCRVIQNGPITDSVENPDGEFYVGGTHKFHMYGKKQWTGETCTLGPDNPVPEPANTDPVKKPPPHRKPPVCDPTEGVLTTGSGKVACVPEGTPDARKPTVQKEEKKENFPDSSSKTTTTTTTTDPATGAKETTTSSTSTGGLSGDAGTTTSSTSGGGGKGTGDGQQGDCSLEPTAPHCKQGSLQTQKGKFDSRDQELETAKQELGQRMDQIKGEISSLFGTVQGGSGSLPCPPPAVVLGRAINFCVADYQDSLSVIGAAVYLMGAIGAAFIILKR